jgi:hypothetical protein
MIIKCLRVYKKRDSDYLINLIRDVDLSLCNPPLRSAGKRAGGTPPAHYGTSILKTRSYVHFSLQKRHFFGKNTPSSLQSVAA